MPQRLQVNEVSCGSRNEEILSGFSRHSVGRLLRLLERHAGLQTSNGTDRERNAIRGIVIQTVRYPNVRSLLLISLGREIQAEVRSQYANNDWSLRRSRHERMAENCRVRPIPPLKIFPADDRDQWQLRTWGRSWRCFRLRHPIFILEIAANRDSFPHQPKEIRGDDGISNLFRRSVRSGQHSSKCEHAGEVFKKIFCPVAQVDVVRI